MAQLVSGNDKFPDLGYDDDYRFYLITRRDASGDYRFAGMHARRVRVRARRALRRVNGYFRNMIETISDAEVQRMERELELRGIRFDNKNWVARTPARTGVRED